MLRQSNGDHSKQSTLQTAADQSNQYHSNNIVYSSLGVIILKEIMADNR